MNNKANNFKFSQVGMSSEFVFFNLKKNPKFFLPPPTHNFATNIEHPRFGFLLRHG
jgi:hypothetical protein